MTDTTTTFGNAQAQTSRVQPSFGGRRSFASHDTGESSANSQPNTDTTIAQPFDDETHTATGHRRSGEHAAASGRDDRAGHRKHGRYRSTGGFLLSDAHINDGPAEPSRSQATRRRQDASGVRKETRQSQPFETVQSTGAAALGRDTIIRGHEAKESSGPNSSSTDAASSQNGGTSTAKSSRSTPSPFTAGGALALDVDSAQIVNMALNLSESRRLASRRNVSQPLPPKLAPFPEATGGAGALKQHLQQQRRTSRNISPRPDKGLVPRPSPAQRLHSPLPAAFDAQDMTYHYHFSPSTLARAQKAKDYLELMAQYRRLLEFVPPLKPQHRPATASPPSSPFGARTPGSFSTAQPMEALGRPYNPLQYIRNRKVRGRERKTIDGEALGFGDVPKVTEWVHESAKWVATGQSHMPGANALPDFDEQHGPALQNSPPASSTGPKPRGPRIDWMIDPIDMLADTYWLEQNSNKRLIEDRHWRRLLPEYREIPKQTRDSVTVPSSRPSMSKDDHTDQEKEMAAGERKSTDGSETYHVGVRERARQKLKDLKGFHHRHESSPAHDMLRVRRHSCSDSSDSGDERKPRVRRRDTISNNDADILEQQMMEMIAREPQEYGTRTSASLELSRPPSSAPPASTPEQGERQSVRMTSRFHGRKDSRADFSESDGKSSVKKQRHGSPRRSGRPSLDVPALARKYSVDDESSPPNSPAIRPNRAGDFVPAIGMDLSPTASRAGSPTRNPLTKVKKMFRERSQTRGERHNAEREDNAATTFDVVTDAASSPETPIETAQSTGRGSSKSPVRKIQHGNTNELSKFHRPVVSINRKDEQGTGLRGLLKHSRIDGLFRGGMSKMGELLARKEAQSSESQETIASTEESDTEVTRGRAKGAAQPSRPDAHRTLRATSQVSKGYIMPDFVPTGSYEDRLNTTDHRVSPTSRPTSQRSSRFDLLKPPRIDVQNASPSPSPPRTKVRPRRYSDITEASSRKSSHTDDVLAADARLNEALSLHNRRARPRDISTTSLEATASERDRQWSITDRKGSVSPERPRVSRREIARLRALILSSGVLANEIDRRSARPVALARPGETDRPRRLTRGPSKDSTDTDMSDMSPSWAAIAKLSPDPLAVYRPAPQRDLYPHAAGVLHASILAAGRAWQSSADEFAGRTAPALLRQAEHLHGRVADELSAMTRLASDEADEVSRDLAVGQRLKVKRVVDVIEKLLRRRRRRFRWVRRAGWLAVEWVLVGFMWYVWFLVMIARVFLGVGKGLVGGVRWLLWI